jgi:hypothetical protein
MKWLMFVPVLMACTPSLPPSACNAVVDDRLQLIAITTPAAITPGTTITIETQWRVIRDLLGTDPKMFVHVTAPGGQLNLLQADHPPTTASMLWHRGDVFTDAFSLTLPATWPSSSAVVRLGWYEGAYRWPVRGDCILATADETHDRFEVILSVANDKANVIDIPHRSSAIAVDGVREDGWQTAAVLGPFVSWDGKEVLTRPTTAYALWDEEALWVLFEATDPDPHSPYHHDDDPLYDSEALEMFIDGNADAHDYIEVQTNLYDAHFDASFVGGARQGMNRAFQSMVVTKTVHNDGVTRSEWRLPWAAVADRPSLLAGAVVAVNLFRLERIRAGTAVKTEASAWQSPLSGDFHNLARLGRWRLLPE